MTTQAPTITSQEVFCALHPVVDQRPTPLATGQLKIELTLDQWNTLNFLFGQAAGDLEAQDEVWQDARRARLDEGGAL